MDAEISQYFLDSSRQNLLNRINHNINIFLSQTRMHGQTYDTLKREFSIRKITYLIAVPLLVERKKVQRDVVDATFNISVTHLINELITVYFDLACLELDNVQVPLMNADCLFPDRIELFSLWCHDFGHCA